MAITETSICNSALAKLGAERINTLTENNKRAKLCNEQYSKMRDEVLVAHPWNFALRRVQLAQLVDAPVFGYSFQYQLPSDCLRVLKCHDNLIKYKVEGTQLLTDSAQMKILYIRQMTDTGDFSAHFAEALALRLASDIAYAMVQSTSLTEQLYGLYEKFVANARSFDAQEGTPEPLIDDTWLDERL